jgi:hypothetical protein
MQILIIVTYSTIEASAEANWLALPTHFRLEGALKDCKQNAVERDFLVSTRLNHLHVLFLLRLALLRGIAEPDARLISVAADMLSLVVETAILKQKLANSGTGLIWKESFITLWFKYD